MRSRRPGRRRALPTAAAATSPSSTSIAAATSTRCGTSPPTAPARHRRVPARGRAGAPRDRRGPRADDAARPRAGEAADRHAREGAVRQPDRDARGRGLRVRRAVRDVRDDRGRDRHDAGRRSRQVHGEQARHARLAARTASDKLDGNTCKRDPRDTTSARANPKLFDRLGKGSLRGKAATPARAATSSST